MLKAAATTKKKNKKTNRLAQHYKCNACNKDFPASSVQVDHIDPVVNPQQGFQDWDTYIERLYINSDGLQVLCKSCHKKKTTKESSGRTKSNQDK